ncbi:MAG: hypothetical protein ACLFSC_01455 [Wenzhouxiangella sp.]
MPFESLIFLLTAFTIAIPFLITMTKCLDQISAENRRISRWQLWLNLIPVFNCFWVFVTAYRFFLSVRAEMRARSAHASKATATLGLITSTLFAGFVAALPFAIWNTLMFFVWILALALYWKEIVLRLVWMIQNPAPSDYSG